MTRLILPLAVIVAGALIAAAVGVTGRYRTVASGDSRVYVTDTWTGHTRSCWAGTCD